MRVIVAEDSAILRQGLVRLLTDEGFEVPAHCGEPGPLLGLVDRYRPDAVLVDIRMPPTHTDEGLRAATAIRARHPHTGILLLSQYVETTATVRALADDGRGFGYLLKERVADADELARSLKQVAAGETVVDPDVVAHLMGGARGASALAELTARERDVLALMAQGRSNHAIAQALVIGAKTVESHVRSIFTKLGIDADAQDNRRVLAVLTYLREA
ncbi:response regulator transcription factor [Streptomyces sp. LHD-70]|uniref:response regulator transcription factor n=1 Tax=Streptomyces sp. LHD-70 TaxID=3072140 RepID=UPI00280E25AE|nr:response regulator transcription factor [Streptomyces sp. LHD-70]MDQ8704980.1 response regulator transcription factor [Streptomyces sp. LHD-70]